MHTPHSLFQIANKINHLYHDLHINNDEHKITADRLVLVGSQSSGKTTLINRIASIDFLPTGAGMVTRTPVHVTLHHTDGEYLATLSTTPNPSSPNPKPTIIHKQSYDEKTLHLDELKKRIIEQTDLITTNKYTISSTPLYVDIYSPKVTNFSFIDLPGLIATWLDDQGQQEGLIEEIKNLAIIHILQPRTTVLAVMQSDTDLQQNIGFALIKEMKTKIPDLNVIGILTKLDTITPDHTQKIEEIVQNTPASSLHLKGGYFLINNTTNNETPFFLKKFPPSTHIIQNKRYGLNNLIESTANQIIHSIKSSLPTIKNNLLEAQFHAQTTLNGLGEEMKDPSQRINFLTQTIQTIGELIESSLESNGNQHNTGQQIGTTFNSLIHNLSIINPFDKETLPDETLTTLINTFNGYHLTTQVSILKIINTCLKDPTTQAITKINKINHTCVKTIITILQQTTTLHTHSTLHPFPKLKKIIIDHLFKTLKSYADSTISFIDKYLEIQSTHIWSKDPQFESTFNELYLPKKSQNDPSSASTFKFTTDQIRTITTAYYKTIITGSQELIIKTIVSEIIKKLEKNIISELNTLLINQDIISNTSLFTEDNTTSQKRVQLRQKIGRINDIIRLIDDMMI